ncbi:MAG: DUF3060 domain-containing protein [Candidatus Obscuribacterales bacterium]|nr:DUF3060 domain-containing protein [Candidatus Obscuribacterales bacterium]
MSLKFHQARISKPITQVLAFCLVTACLQATAVLADSNYPGIPEAQSAIEGTKASLSDFEAKLEFPLSSAEKEESQSEVNRQRDRFKANLPKSVAAGEIARKAKEALELARQAGSQAETGDRSKAIDCFTRSRISLWQARLLLAAFDSQATGQKPSKRLLGSARQDDSQAQTSQSRADSSTPASPGGIVVDSTSPASRQTVSIQPNSIQVVEQTIGPGRRENVATTTTTITGNSPASQANAAIGAYSNNTNFGNPARINIGAQTPAADAAIDIGPAGVQIGGNTPGGRAGISIGNGGVSLGNLGQAISNIARTGIDTAFGTVDGVLGTNTTGGHTFTITGHDQRRTLDCNGQRVAITGRNNKITIRGYCQAVNLTGHDNEISVETTGTIGVTGHDNRVSWRQGQNGLSPKIFDTGRNNIIWQQN